MGKKILLPVDGSGQSLEAVRYAAKVLSSKDLRIVLFHVMSEVPEIFYDLGKKRKPRQELINLEVWERRVKDLMDRFMSKARQLLIHAGVPDEGITIKIQDRKTGIARDIIAESAHDYEAVILGRTGVNKFEGFVIGGVANKLIEKLTHASLCVVGGRPKTGRILLSLDESESAMRAVNSIGKMMDSSKTKVTLFHVIRDFNIYQKRYEDLFSLTFEEEWIETGKNEMESLFKIYRTYLTKSGFTPGRITTKIMTGVKSRSEAILKEAIEGHYGAIMLGRRGMSKVQEFHMGRVSTKVIHLARNHAVWVVS
ncbi:MAG: universal stress protein [Pseudomonadota bacterium]